MNISSYIIPVFILLILITSAIQKKNTFNSFTDGVKDALPTGLEIFPGVLAVMCASAMLQASGGADVIKKLLSPLFQFFSIPSELTLLSVLRPVSGSGSLAILSDILSNYGPDSYIGKTACIIMASTETSIYTTALYFSVTKIKNTRHTLICALLADFFCVIISCTVCNIFFK